MITILPKRLTLGAALAFIASPALAQPLPPGNAAPPPDHSAEKAVLVPIDAVFAAARTGDAAAMLAQVFPEGRVTATGTRGGGASGLRAQSWAEFAQRVTPATAFDERISDPAIEVDGDVAMVWARFVVRRGGSISNCGYDHFDLVRDNGVWKIMNLSFSSRITDCGA